MALLNFRADTLAKAFLLNAIATSLIAVLTVEIKSLLDRYLSTQNQFISTLITLITSFLGAIIIYWALFLIFGFGGGMITTPKPPKVF